MTVVADHEVAERLRSGATNRVDQRLTAAAGTVLRTSATLADRAGMPIETTQLNGDPAPSHPGTGTRVVGGPDRHFGSSGSPGVAAVRGQPDQACARVLRAAGAGGATLELDDL